MERVGIDVSTHQGDINWAKVKGSVDFAIIRAGYGKNNIDNKARKNVQGCEANGIPYGFYWFSYAYTKEMAEKEAEYFIKFASEYKPSYPLYFDFEYDSVEYASKMGVTITKELLHTMATAFCETLEKNGYYAGIYANADYINNKFKPEIFKKHDLWYAYWGDKPSRSVNLWQYTASGTVDGISGKVDMNKCYIDYPSIIIKANLNGYKDSENKDETTDNNTSEDTTNTEPENNCTCLRNCCCCDCTRCHCKRHYGFRCKRC